MDKTRNWILFAFAAISIALLILGSPIKLNDWVRDIAAREVESKLAPIEVKIEGVKAELVEIKNLIKDIFRRELQRAQKRVSN